MEEYKKIIIIVFVPILTVLNESLNNRWCNKSRVSVSVCWGDWVWAPAAGARDSFLDLGQGNARVHVWAEQL
jgi:hypothetical protein